MARQKRLVSSTGRYHVLLRGMNVLFKTEEDFDAFTGILQKYLQEGNIKLLAYVLLDNRVHLIVDTKGAEIGTALKPICTSYARCYNRTHGGSGKLFYDRFKSEPIDTEDRLLSAVAFVNFIAANRDEHYKYCSMNSNICDIAGTGLTEQEFRNKKITDMYIEDYDCLSEKDLGRFIYELCGIFPKDFKSLSVPDQKAIFELLAHKRWISKSKLYELLGVGRTIQRKTEQPAESVPKKDLSVWLL